MTSKGQFVLNAQPFFSLKSSTRSSHSEIMPARQNLSHGAGVLDTHTHTHALIRHYMAPFAKKHKKWLMDAYMKTRVGHGWVAHKTAAAPFPLVFTSVP